MKKIKFFLIILLGSILIAGCRQSINDSNPVGPETSIKSSQPDWQKAAETQGLELLNFSDELPQRLNKILSAEEYILPQRGGMLVIWDRFRTNQGRIGTLRVVLRIPRYALNTPETYRMELDEDYLSPSFDFTFGPHATFNNPVKLSIEAEGMDFSGWPNIVHLYYFDPDLNTWIPTDGVGRVNHRQNSFECEDVSIPHFSRYAFSK